MPNVVRVLTVDLDQPPAVVVQLDAALPEPDRRGRPGERVARAVARELVADVAGIPAADVVITRRCTHCGDPNHGKPALLTAPGLSFSVSHSADLGVVAIASGATVGVDVEALRPRGRLDALARKIFNDAEVAQWRAAPAGQQLDRFVRAWTVKEAYLKATGTGIATNLSAVPLAPAGWTLHELAMPAGYVATLAVDRADVAVEQAVWVPPPVIERAGTGR